MRRVSPLKIMTRRFPKRKKLGVFKSSLEKSIAASIKCREILVKYETFKIGYIKPVSNHTYTPDFLLPNNVIIEAKGLFSTQDRKKHILVKEQHPELDIRFVFSRSSSKLYKGSKTTYADWCNRHGFLYADTDIPKEWYDDEATH